MRQRRGSNMSIQVFRDLHQGPALLVLPNAWDAITARLIEGLGAKAIATTRAGLAWSRGYPDGNALPVDQLIAATRDLDTLQKHGVRRLSAGSAIAQAALGCTRHLAADFLAGTLSEMFGAAVQYGAVNQLFANI